MSDLVSRPFTAEEQAEHDRMAKAADNPAERAHYEAQGWRYCNRGPFRNCWFKDCTYVFRIDGVESETGDLQEFMCEPPIGRDS